MKVNFSHPTPGELADYAARRLAAADVLKISDHLAGCAACRGALVQFRQTPVKMQIGDFLFEPAVEVPGFDDLAGEVDGTLTPARHAELAAKLARSSVAREALADLAAFRDELAALPTKHHHPNVKNVVTPPACLWRKTVARAASLAALIMALAVGSWLLFVRPGQVATGLLRGSDGRTAVLGGLPVELRNLVETAAQSGRLPPLAATLATGREVLAGRAAKVLLTAISPVGIVVREQLPLLQWSSLPGATGYVVSIAGADGGLLTTSPLLPSTQTHWAPVGALPRGQTYQWQVEARRDEVVIDRTPKPPAGEARFQILDAASNHELDEVEAHDAGVPLVLGVAYWRAGLTAAAAAQFDRLARAHADSAAARRLARTAAESATPSHSPAAQ